MFLTKPLHLFKKAPAVYSFLQQEYFDWKEKEIQKRRIDQCRFARLRIYLIRFEMRPIGIITDFVLVQLLEVFFFQSAVGERDCFVMIV